MSTLKYRPEIDGLRAVAVVPVVLFHSGIEWMSGGYTGVDVFFVISGFLITSIILKEHEAGEFRFLNFWGRRIRRILPAMTAMLLATLVAGLFILLGTDINRLALHGVAALLSVANISMWRLAGNYWGTAETSPLLHTWSLSVEEQFYLFFPAFLILLLRYARNHVVLVVLVVNILSFAAYLYGSVHHSWATFYLLPTRAWEMGLGSLLAILVSHRHLDPGRSGSQLLSMVGLLLIVGSALALSGQTPFPGQLLLPVAGTLMVIAFSANSQHWVNRLLTQPAVLYIGRISYSLYLWHWPVIVLFRFVQLRMGWDMPELVTLVLILPLSMASYHFIENPTRKREGVIPYILGFFAVTLVASVVVHRADFSHHRSAFAEDHQLSRYHEFMAGLPAPGRTDREVYVRSFAHGAGSPTIVVLGDSQVGVFGPLFDNPDGSGQITTHSIGQAGIDWNFVDDRNKNHAEFRTRVDLAKQLRPDILVVVARWSSYLNEREHKHPIADILAELSASAGQLIIIGQPPECHLRYHMTDTRQYLLYRDWRPLAGDAEHRLPMANAAEFRVATTKLRAIAAALPNAHLVEFEDIFARGDGQVRVSIGDRILYTDDNHLSPHGVALLRDRVEQTVRECLTDIAE